MKKILLIIIGTCLIVTSAGASEDSVEGECCESCTSFEEAMRNDLPELFGDGSSFAAAGEDLDLEIASRDALKTLPSDDITLTSLTTITSSKPAPKSVTAIPLNIEVNLSGKNRVEAPAQDD